MCIYVYAYKGVTSLLYVSYMGVRVIWVYVGREYSYPVAGRWLMPLQYFYAKVKYKCAHTPLHIHCSIQSISLPPTHYHAVLHTIIITVSSMSFITMATLSTLPPPEVIGFWYCIKNIHKIKANRAHGSV